MISSRFEIKDSASNPVKVVTPQKKAAEAASPKKTRSFKLPSAGRLSFKGIRRAGTFIRYPFGHEKSPNLYVADVTQRLHDATVSYGEPAAQFLIRAMLQAAKQITAYVPGMSSISRVSYPFLHALIVAGSVAWNYGGKQTAGRLYHHLMCERDKSSEGKPTWHFSPLQVANTAAFGTLALIGKIAVPIAVSAVAFVGEPIYMKVFRDTYTNMEITSKDNAEGADGIYKFYATSLVERAKAVELRKQGRDIEDDDLGRRFDVEQNWWAGIHDPTPIFGAIPNAGRCDKIETTGIYFRTGRIKMGFFTLLKAKVWLAPEILSTTGCRAYNSGEQGSLAPVSQANSQQLAGQAPVYQTGAGYRPYITKVSFGARMPALAPS